MEGVSVRAWRALSLIGVALIAVVAMGAVYLGPDLVRALSPAPAPSPTRAPVGQLAAVSFVDADHGMVAMGGPSTPGATYRTADGGRTWTLQWPAVVPATFLDRDHAVAINPIGWWLETSVDGGRTWMREAAPFGDRQLIVGPFGVMGGPTFLDATNAWWLDPGPAVQAAALWRTGDGGRTWRQLAASGIPTGLTLGQPAFVDLHRGAIVAAPTTSYAWPSLLVTQDGGETWRPEALPEPLLPGAHLAGPGPLDRVTLVRGARLVLSLDLLPAGIVGGSSRPPSDSMRWSSVSDDGGLSWAPWSNEPAAGLAIGWPPVFDDAGRLVLTDDRRLWTSADGGRSWQQARALQMPHGVQPIGVVSAHAGALFLLAVRGPLQAGTLVEIVLLRSRDGGGHWTEVPLPRSAVQARR